MTFREKNWWADCLWWIFYFLNIFFRFNLYNISLYLQLYINNLKLSITHIYKQKIASRKTLFKITCNSHSQMFFKIGVLKNLANFTRKHLCWSPFRLQYWRFPVKFATFFRTSFFTEHLQWLLMFLVYFVKT